MSVLILEDNRQILNVLEELVMSVAEDEKVYATDNVGEAYKIAMETSIDVFLLDIILYTDKKRRYIRYAVCTIYAEAGALPFDTYYFYYFIRRPGNVCFAGFARFWIY